MGLAIHHKVFELLLYIKRTCLPKNLVRLRLILGSVLRRGYKSYRFIVFIEINIILEE